MKFYGLVNPKTPEERFMQRANAMQALKTSGTGIPPLPPRGLSARSGSRKVALSWELPVNARDIVGWNVYRETENNLVLQIANSGIRQADIACSAGSPSPVVNFFVASVSASGSESQKVQVQGSASTEAGAPVDPPPPPPPPSGSGGDGDTRGKFVDPNL